MKTFVDGVKTNLKYFIGIIIATVVGGLTTAIVLAAIPDSNGIIHGCRSNLGGSLRVIDDATQNCRTGETTLNWNQALLAGNTISVRKVIPYDSIDQPFFTITGLGPITVGCSSNSSTNVWKYTNTSSQAVYIDGNNTIDPGDTYATDALNGPYTVLLATGNGAGSQVASLIIKQTSSPDSPYDCTFTAQATSSVN